MIIGSMDPSSNVSGDGIDHFQGQACCNSSIDCISALLEYLDARLRPQFGGRCDKPMYGFHCRMLRLRRCNGDDQGHEKPETIADRAPKHRSIIAAGAALHNSAP